tara:strand:+ start:160 stop:435 length:276 start_codon:yes stop_codon:yes gene_type:complete
MQKIDFYNFIRIFYIIFSNSLRDNYWLVIGTYRQGAGGRPEVCGLTSTSLYSISMENLYASAKAGEKITNEIYKPVWQFDSRWTCIFSGNN